MSDDPAVRIPPHVCSEEAYPETDTSENIITFVCGVCGKTTGMVILIADEEEKPDES